MLKKNSEQLHILSFFKNQTICLIFFEAIGLDMGFGKKSNNAVHSSSRQKTEARVRVFEIETLIKWKIK